jgi:ATP10 protein
LSIIITYFQKFASYLELPNKYTGYAYLLDQQNRVRWRGCGQAEEGEIQAMIKCAELLVEEGNREQQQQQQQIGKGAKKTKGKSNVSST